MPPPDNGLRRLIQVLGSSHHVGGALFLSLGAVGLLMAGCAAFRLAFNWLGVHGSSAPPGREETRARVAKGIQLRLVYRLGRNALLVLGAGTGRLVG